MIDLIKRLFGINENTIPNAIATVKFFGVVFVCMAIFLLVMAAIFGFEPRS